MVKIPAMSCICYECETSWRIFCGCAPIFEIFEIHKNVQHTDHRYLHYLFDSHTK